MVGLNMPVWKLGTLALLVLAQFTHAEEEPVKDVVQDKPKGFSYFAAGVERINYRERITVGGARVETDTTTENVVLLSGGRTFINRVWSFSINATSTLYPNRATEEWKLKNSIDVRTDEDGDGALDTTTTFEPQTLQTNRFTYTQAATQILFHYHPDLWWSIDGGMTYSLGTFKRFAFKSKSALAADQGDAVVEETFGELSAHAGASVVLPITEQFRFRTAFQGGAPVISRIENTLHPNLIFDSTSGWNAEVTASFVYHFNENINLGVVYDFQYQFKDKQSKNDPDTNTTVYIPENIRMSNRYGMVISWAF